MVGKTSKKSAKIAKKAAAKRVVAKPALLAGGNPQVAKGDGDAPVQAYIAAMPGWKHDVGHRLDALIARTLPNVCKAVRWNTPFYGIDGQGWFLGFHCLTKYVKVSGRLQGDSSTSTSWCACSEDTLQYVRSKDSGRRHVPAKPGKYRISPS
jgi:hypothetical protein